MNELEELGWKYQARRIDLCFMQKLVVKDNIKDEWLDVISKIFELPGGFSNLLIDPTITVSFDDEKKHLEVEVEWYILQVLDESEAAKIVPQWEKFAEYHNAVKAARFTVKMPIRAVDMLSIDLQTFQYMFEDLLKRPIWEAVESQYRAWMSEGYGWDEYMELKDDDYVKSAARAFPKPVEKIKEQLKKDK